MKGNLLTIRAILCTEGQESAKMVPQPQKAGKPLRAGVDAWLKTATQAQGRHRPLLFALFEASPESIIQALQAGVTAAAMHAGLAEHYPHLQDVSLWSFQNALRDWRKLRKATKADLAPGGSIRYPAFAPPAPSAAPAPLTRQAPEGEGTRTTVEPAPRPRSAAELREGFVQGVVLPAAREGRDAEHMGALALVNPEASTQYARPRHPLEAQLQEAEDAAAAQDAEARRRLMEGPTEVSRPPGG